MTFSLSRLSAVRNCVTIRSSSVRRCGTFVFFAVFFVISGQELPVERCVCECECFRIKHAMDSKRHIQRRDKAEATPALIIPTIIVRIERQALAHFLEAAREFPAHDDAASRYRPGRYLL